MNRRELLKSIGPALAAVVALPKVLSADRRKTTGNTHMLNGKRETDTWRSGPASDYMKNWSTGGVPGAGDEVAIDQPWQRDPNAFHIMGPEYKRLFYYTKRDDGWYCWQELMPAWPPLNRPECWQLDKPIIGNLSSVSVGATHPLGMVVGVRQCPELRQHDVEYAAWCRKHGWWRNDYSA